jgi:hypothetical protein
MKKDHYQKAADEIIKAVKEVRRNPFIPLDIGEGKKLVIQMLRANFIAKKSKWK